MGLKIGDVSPLGALVTGKGALADVAGKGMMGLIPAMMMKGRGDDKEAPAEQAQKMRRRGGGSGMGRGMGRGMQAQGMKKGGKVKKCAASKRGDGCAQRGKTRGKMV